MKKLKFLFYYVLVVSLIYTVFPALFLGAIYLSYVAQYKTTFLLFFAISLILGAGYIAVVKCTTFAFAKSEIELSEDYYRFLVLVSFIILIFSIPNQFAAFFEQISEFEQCISTPQEPIDFQYFSFTTFTTLGYGDQAPVGFCRQVAITEAMLGMTIMPIMIALVLYVLKQPVENTSL